MKKTESDNSSYGAALKRFLYSGTSAPSTANLANGNLPQWLRNSCGLCAVATTSIPSTILAYMPQRGTIHFQQKGLKVSISEAATAKFTQTKYPTLRYLWKGAPYAIAVAPLFKLGFAGPMMIAKDISQRDDCRHPLITYFSGAFSTVIFQTFIDFDRRMKQLNQNNPKHYWKVKYLHKNLPPFFLYMNAANLSSLLFYDASYEWLLKKYPEENKWWIGAGASALSLPFAQAVIVPVDTWATRIMSGGVEKGLSGPLFRRVFLMRSLWKVIENGFLLTASYSVKDTLIDWISECSDVPAEQCDEVLGDIAGFTSLPYHHKHLKRLPAGLYNKLEQTTDPSNLSPTYIRSLHATIYKNSTHLPINHPLVKLLDEYSPIEKNLVRKNA